MDDPNAPGEVITPDYEDYCEWAGDDAMPQDAFAASRMRYPRSAFDTLHRWWQRADSPGVSDEL